MKRLWWIWTMPLLLTASPLWAGPQRQNFALSFDGGVFWEAGADFFEDASPLAGVGLEYYPLNPFALGAQFLFSVKDNFGGPVMLNTGGIGGFGTRTTDRLYQTTIFIRLTEPSRSALKFSTFAGLSINQVARSQGGGIVPAGSDGLESEGSVWGAKLGAETFIRLKNETHLNFLFSVDTKPQTLLSAQAGLTFFFNPFQRAKTNPID